MTEIKKEEKKLTPEQKRVIKNTRKKLVVSASAGSGKTFVVVEKLIKLICEKQVPVSRLLVLTFTKAAANELKSRLFSEILNQPSSPFLIEQLDDIMVSDISTIDSFCEKVIKRNINKLSLPQNFAILDEKSGKNLKNFAFKRTFEHFSSQKSQVFDEIYFAFKRNQDSLEECVESMQAFFDSLSNGEQLLNNFSSDFALLHKKACQKLIEDFKSAFEASNKFLSDAILESDMIGEKLGKGHINFIEGLKNFLNVDFSQDFFTLCKSIAQKPMPALSSAKCDAGVKAKLSNAKDELLGIYDIAKQLQFANDKMIVSAEQGALAKKLTDFYIYYAKEYKTLKEKRSALDFADLEKYAQALLCDDEVKKSLQQRYDYIIIDEYQDTNRLQESILKPIAEGGYFIAVGDIKQGIYGFRNASKDIMSEDIASFSKSKNGKALYLRGNFRTDNRILTFVNTIFEKLMTTESVGIDYKETSMLKGLNKFKPNNLPAVTVDVVCTQKPKQKIDEDDRQAEENKDWENIYSVKDAEIEETYKYKDEILTIATRIEETLVSQIYSPKLKAFRNVEMGDIALLFRKRSPLMQECVQFLQEKGFAVNADIKENLLEDSQIALIVSLLKLTINPKDDIPLASVMASPFGDFSIEELGKIRESHPEGNFHDIVNEIKNDENDYGELKEKIVSFFDMLEKFKFEMQVYGIIKALQNLFNKSYYIDYLESFDDSALKKTHLNKLYAQIRSGDLDFNPQELISQLESEGKDEKSTADGGNAITITTIHATKGLEYPIVIICGGGETLSKVYNKQYIVEKDFGVGTYLYSFEENLRIPSPVFLAGKNQRKNREQIDELMLFYVAMTRAQNHLYIIGSGKESDYTFDNLLKQNSYLKQIFFALGESFTSSLFSQQQVITENATYNIITEVETLVSKDNKNTFQQKQEESSYQKFKDEILKYQQFEYENKKGCFLSYKNSVTGVTKLNGVENEYGVGETLYKENDDEIKISEEQKLAREKTVEVGNSYHEALKLVDFTCISAPADLNCQLEKIKAFMSEGYYENIDQNLLFKNILLIKSVIGDNAVYKESEFIMQSKPAELLGNDENLKDKNGLIVQGIIDLFAIGEKIVLIDYKYTSVKDENRLIERYGGQIKLYSLALEKAFGRKVDEKYLLSLKQGKLILLD